MSGRTVLQATEMVWSRLEGKIADQVFRAPLFCREPVQVPPIVVGYLERNVLGYPWADHLALLAVVLAANHLDVQTIRGRMIDLHPRFKRLFPALGLSTMEDWLPDHHLPMYLRGDILPHDTPFARARFRSVYETCTFLLKRWSLALPGLGREEYRRFLLLPVAPDAIKGLISLPRLRSQQQAKRKQETDAIVPRFADLRAEANWRYNRMLRLQTAYQQALQVLHDREQQGVPCSFPFAFSYDEGGNPEQGIPARERLHFRIWDRRSFALAHPEGYTASTRQSARSGHNDFRAEKNRLFLEWVNAERLHDDASVEGFWFAELLCRGLVGSGTLQISAENQAWLRTWGYGKAEQPNIPTPFSGKNGSILGWSQKDAVFMHHAQRHAEGTLIPVDELYATALFGLLAITVFTTTGMRSNEAQQIRPTPDCLIRLVTPAPPGARDQRSRVRYALRLIPKGERGNVPQNYFIGPETMRVLTRVAQYLCRHYGIASPSSLPSVPFSSSSGRAHRFGPAPYLLQHAGYHLHHDSMVGSMRFLLHGMVFRAREGQLVILTPHKLRHAFATHAVHVEKIPVDIVGEWLKQKNLDVTAYYSQATELMLGELADQFLAHLACHLDVADAVRRSPEALQTLYEEARGKAGTLAEVIGGYCTMHGYCPAKFACIGCPAHVPDPAKRIQIERQQRWGRKQIQMATEEGLLPEAERMRQLVRDCATTLAEMDEMEAYQRDETRPIFLHVDDH